VPIKFGKSFNVSLARDRTQEESAFLDLTPEEREKCRKFWWKFRLLERTQIFSLFIPMLVLWVFPRVERHIPWALGVTIVLIFGVTHVWMYNLDCPRCGVKFSGGLIALLPRIRYPWDCYGCDLSRSELKYISNHLD